jgi:histidine triad (HIT) family protein
MSEPCIFCRIADGTIPAGIVAQNDTAVAFRDLHPQAPTHILVIPRVHVASLADDGAEAVLPGVLALLRQVAAEQGLAENGYRAVANVGADGGQTVHHLHFHLLGGRALHWPPG